MTPAEGQQQSGGAMDWTARLEAAEKAAAARDKAIQELMQSVQEPQTGKGPALDFVAPDAEVQQVAERKTLEMEQRASELANSLSLLNATLEATADGILVVDESGRITGFNGKFLEMFRIPREVADRNAGEEMLEITGGQLKNPRQFLMEVQNPYVCPEGEAFDVMDFNDGRVFERYSKPRRIGNEIAGRVWSFRDITDRKRMQQEVERTHKLLVTASRQAGMAEVAVGVLHNVGNVLNSANVSAKLICSQLKQSRLASLSKLSGMLQEHTHDIQRFLSEDERGRKVPPYLSQLAERLQIEQDELRSEAENLVTKIEHINEIVAAQQNYASYGGVKQTIDLPELIEDALNILGDSFQRHGVSVVRELDAVPAISLDKHKALQILVNLLHNANWACQAANQPVKQVTIRMKAGEKNRINIEVADNGIGISPENLTRVFAQGFTTRKGGHGLGLHSGALAARELGGSLTAHSDGPLRGATFRLELPLQLPTG